METQTDAVRQFVARFCSISVNRVHVESTLLGDLGIDGDDAVDFFIEFGKHFAVDLSGLDLSRHFLSEGEVAGCLMGPYALLMILKRLFVERKSVEQELGLKPVSVADLVAAVEARAWDNSRPENTGRSTFSV